MHPYVTLWGYPVETYSLLLLLGTILGMGWAFWRLDKAGVPPLPPVFCVLLGGLLGSKLLIWAFSGSVDRALVGTSWYGWLLGGLAATAIYARIRRLSILTLLDIAVPAFLLGLAFTRIGCFLAGCCYGLPCDLLWAVHFPPSHRSHGVGVHPVQLYESVLDFALFAVLHYRSLMASPPRVAGEVAFRGIWAYALIRLLMELLREPSRSVPLHWLGLGVNAWISVVLALAAFAWLWRYTRQK